MRNTASIPVLKDALKRERRTNRRLRTIIDNLRTQVETNRNDLKLQFTRLAQLQAEVDGLKAKSHRQPA
jgi:hypothetical protein